MRIIDTIVPISIDNLKEYFSDKEVTFNIDYTNSEIKGTKFLTYLSNLDVPCDVSLTSKEDAYELIKEYLKIHVIVNIPALELATINLLLQAKGLAELNDKEFLLENKDIITEWIKKLDSMTVYNMYTVNDESFKQFAEQFPQNDTDDTTGINFVSLLKWKEFYQYYNVLNKDNCQVYKKYFDEPMFKGQPLYAFWANENNPMFILTYGIAEGMVDPDKYIKAKKEDVEKLNVTPV